MTTREYGSPQDWQPESFMGRLPEELRSRLLRTARVTRHEAGEHLLMQGDPSTHVHVLRSMDPTGSRVCAKITRGLKDGTEGLLGIRLSGDIIGESAAVRGTVRSASVVACTPMRTYVLTREAFLRFLDEDPRAWRTLTCVLADRLDAANRRRLDAAAFTVAVRLARALVELVERHGVKCEDGYQLGVHLSQAELGRLIGAGEDAVQTAMRQLRAKNLVVAHYRKVLVTDLHELRDFSRTP